MNQERKLVVITGVSRGLGAAMMEQFIARGHTVAGCSRSEKPLKELRARHGGKSRFSQVDVSDMQQVEQWAAEIIKELGAPHLLINNAALINRSAPLWEMEPGEFSQVIDVNIKGVFHVIRAFVPSMLLNRAGTIVNFSSGWGRSTSAEVAPYCASKWAIEGLTQALAQELPDGMAAVPLNPGVIDTEMLRSCFGEGAGGYPKAEEWAQKAVPFILGLDGSHNGQSLSVPS